MPNEPFSQFVGFATAPLSKRHSLRDVVANLSAQGSKLYHLGVKAVTRSSFARVNEEQPYTLYEALFAKLYDRCQRAVSARGLSVFRKMWRSGLPDVVQTANWDQTPYLGKICLRGSSVSVMFFSRILLKIMRSRDGLVRCSTNATPCNEGS